MMRKDGRKNYCNEEMCRHLGSGDAKDFIYGAMISDGKKRKEKNK